MRSDSAGYQRDLLHYCAEGQNERSGVFDFAVSVDVTPAFRQAVHEVAEEDWKPLQRDIGGRLVDTGQQWAEVCFVPNAAARKKQGASYRFLAIREPLRQLELDGMESDQAELPFPTISYSESGPPGRFKLFGVVTNRDHRPSGPARGPCPPADAAAQRRSSVGSASDRGPTHPGSLGRRTLRLTRVPSWPPSPRSVHWSRSAAACADLGNSQVNRCESRLCYPVARRFNVGDASRLRRAALGEVSCA